MEKKTGKEKDFAFFPYDATHEKSIKIDFSGNIKLKNGNKGTILGVKGVSKDGNTKFIRIFSQSGVLFKGDDKFTGDITWTEHGGKKAHIGWLNDKGDIVSGYANDPSAPKSEKIPF